MTSEFATNLLKVYHAIINVLANKVNISDITDNLTTNDATKPLSAKQGKILKEQIDSLIEEHCLELTITGDSFSSNEDCNSPFTYTGTVTIDWGDNTTENYTDGQLTHTYNTSGTYKIKIKGNITSINADSFFSCLNLIEITILKNITTLERACFGNCSNLKSVTIFDGVTSFGQACFSSCTSLENIIIPNTVTEIGYISLGWCSSLKSITIPNSVTFIGDACFSNCKQLATVIFTNSTPPSVTSSSLRGIPSNCNIYVPKGSLSAYTSASNYPSSSTYTYIEIEDDVVQSIVDGVDKAVSSDAVYDALSELSTETITITYDDDSTETLTLFVQDDSS